jgi:hypothetical protein
MECRLDGISDDFSQSGNAGDVGEGFPHANLALQYRLDRVHATAR